MDTEKFKLAPEIVEFMREEGFPPFVELHGSLSVANLFTKNKRTGLYLLRFVNGEFYVGKTRNIVARFAAHHRTHDDIDAISFKPMSARRIDQAETKAIEGANFIRHMFRNVDGILDPIGERDLDLIVPYDAQSAWLDDPGAVPRGAPLLRAARPPEIARYRDLTAFRDWPKIRELAKKYINTCIVAPRLTERVFWTVTVFVNSNIKKREFSFGLRFNVNWQETLYIFVSEAKPDVKFAVFVALSELPQEFDGIFGLSPDGGLFQWPKGGADQCCLVGSSYNELHAYLDTAHVARAARMFNLGLMRKGAVPRNRAESHCGPLVDDILEDASQQSA